MHVPDFDPERTLGPEVAAVATLAGFPPDPEQRMMLDAAFALDKRGKSVAFEVVVIAPRQNIKTGFFKQVALGQAFVREEALVVWSAHEFDTAKEAVNDLETLIDGSDVLRRRVKLTERGNVASHGSVPEIRLLKAKGVGVGARLKFKTRTSGGGRGLSGRKVVLDEGYALQANQVGALYPIMLAQPDPQIYIGSSACRPESAVLYDIVQRGRAGNDPRMVYVEWCAPDPVEVCAGGEKCLHTVGTQGCACDDAELLTQVHSAITRERILLQTVVDLRRTMPPEEYGREVMGWHDKPLLDMNVIDVATWLKRVNVDAPRPLGPALAVDVTPDRKASSIATAGRVDGKYHVDILDHRPGTGWVVDRLVELTDEIKPCVVTLDPAGPAGAFVKELVERGFRVDAIGDQWLLQLVDGREYAQSCGALVDDVVNDGIRHRNRRELNAAVEGLMTRPLADAYAWSRKDSTVDISPLVAVTLARHGYATYGVDMSLEPIAMWG